MTKPSLFEEKLDVDTERRRAFNRRCTPNTKEEQAAIRALKRLAKKWPKTLGLVHFGTGSSLSVVRLEPDYDGDLSDLENVDSVTGFNANSSA